MIEIEKGKKEERSTSIKMMNRGSNQFLNARVGGVRPMESLLQRKCACGRPKPAGGECGACQEKKRDEMLQRRASGSMGRTEVPAVVHEVLRSPGQPLDRATQAFMEPRFGHDFSRVRVHTDTKAAESAQAVNALAYAVGKDIAFAPGQYAPSTVEGQVLLAHELTHVAQQAWTTPVPRGGLRIAPPDGALEREAENFATRILQNDA